MEEALDPISSTVLTRYRGHTCNPSTEEVQAGESEVQGCLQLCNEFKASLGYMKLHPSPQGEKPEEMRLLGSDRVSDTFFRLCAVIHSSLYPCSSLQYRSNFLLLSFSLERKAQKSEVTCATH